MGGILGGAASALTGSLLTDAFGPDDPDIPLRTNISGFNPISLTTPGFGFKGDDQGVFSLTRGGAVSDPLAELRGLTDKRTADLEELLGLVEPGFGEITNRRVESIKNAALKASSDLRGNLSRRKVLGSGFGESILNSVASEFGRQEADAKAQSFLEELDVTTKLLDAQFQTSVATVNEFVNQANLEANAAINLINSARATFSNNADIIGRIGLANAAGFAKSIEPITSGIGNIFAGDPLGVGGIGGLLGGGGGGTVTNTGGLFGSDGFTGGGGDNTSGGLGSSATTAGLGALFSSLFAASDRRIKKDITRVGTTDGGLPVYTFRYKSGGPMQMGVMAQDLEENLPSAVVEVDGVKMVDYGQVT